MDVSEESVEHYLDGFAVTVAVGGYDDVQTGGKLGDVERVGVGS